MFLFQEIYISIMGQIRDIMEKDVITIENDKTAQDAAKIIAEKDISFLVITVSYTHLTLPTKRIV